MNARTSALSVGVLALVVVLGHLTLFPKIADLDGFYHIGHAFAYAENGLFDSSLPWATKSIIGDRGADLWWGFHVGLMPFTAIQDVDWAIRIGALMMTVTLALTVLWVLGRHAVIGAGWWTVFFFIAVPNVFFRDLMLRPHVLSAAGGVALLSIMVRGRSRHLFWVSALITWLHLGLFWFAPGIGLAYVLVRTVEGLLGAEPSKQSVAPGKVIAATFIGTVVGWLLRPDPIGAGMLANVQIVRLFLEKATDAPIAFASELQPMPVLELVRTSWLFLTAWMMVLLGTLVRFGQNRLAGIPRAERTMLVTALLISGTFALLAVTAARRGLEQWVAFGALALPLFWTHVVYVYRRRTVRRFVAAALVVHVAWGGWRHALNVEHVAFDHDTLESAAEFLEANSEPGEVVFHARWDNFGPLLAHNRTNFYIGGMDPIFQFVHEPRFYWEYFYISADINVEWTCDAFPCASGAATDTHTVLRDHFGARWVLVEPSRNPRLSLFLLNDERFRLAHEADRTAVFEVVDAPRAAPVDGEPGPPRPGSTDSTGLTGG